MSNHAADRPVPGTWPSPIDAATAAAAAVIAGDLRADGDCLYWVEMRPEDDGRCVLVRQRGDAAPEDVTDPDVSVRTRVHEYGGGAVAADAGRLAWVRDPDGTLWLADDDGAAAPRRLTAPEDGRFADPCFDPVRPRLLAVRERPRTSADGPPSRGRTMIRSIAEIRFDAAAGDSPAVRDLIVGPDFLAAPRIAPHGRELAWTTWDHPNMPWDASTLHRAELREDGSLPADGPRRTVAGGDERREMVTDPQWSPGGDLFFVSDRDGQWGLYRDAPAATGGVEVVLRPGTDTGWLPWKFGIGHYAIAPPAGVLVGVRRSGGLPPTRLVLMPARQGTTGRPAVLDAEWARINTLTAARQARHLPGFGIEPAASVADAARAAASLGASPNPPAVDLAAIIDARAETPDTPVAGAIATDFTRPSAILRIDPSAPAGRAVRVVRELSAADVDPAFLPVPEQIRFPGAGADGDADSLAYAWFYSPAHPDHDVPAGQAPPLLLRAHGGPTGAARLELDLEIRYWTSRGWAFCDVDYGGSAGYGRAYRERLRRRWGEVDVDDCAGAARHLAETGRVDGERMAIVGGSAGGFTVLLALARTDVFRAGINRFGVADLEGFVGETHDFEAYYLDGLIGPWPEAAATFRARSPIEHADTINAPLLVLQGEEDRVVPPAQSRRIIAALEARGVPVESAFFAGEQHGFRRQDTLVTSIDRMEAFLRRHVLAPAALDG